MSGLTGNLRLAACRLLAARVRQALDLRTIQRRPVTALGSGVKFPPLHEVADAARGDAEELRGFRPGDPPLGLRRRKIGRAHV